MKLISKTHITAIKTVSLYIASSIVNIFVKNPKVLSVGEKVNYGSSLKIAFPQIFFYFFVAQIEHQKRLLSAFINI